MKYPTEEDVLVLSVQENLSRTYNPDKRLVEFACLIVVGNALRLQKKEL